MGLLDWILNRNRKNDEYDVPEELYLQRPEISHVSTSQERSENENSSPPEKPIQMTIKPEIYDLTTNVLGLIHNSKLFRGIDAVHAFMSINLEFKGFNDAFRNSDSSHMESTMKVLFQDFNVLITRAKTYYSEKLKDHQFHKLSRENLGMKDLGMEIASEIDKINALLALLDKLESDTMVDHGKSLRVIASYEIGFKNGLAKITADKLLNGNEDIIPTI